VTLDFLSQRVNCASLGIANYVPVLLESSAGIAVTKLTLYNTQRHTLFELFACCGMTERM
jgi:hypothetical protein